MCATMWSIPQPHLITKCSKPDCMYLLYTKHMYVTERMDFSKALQNCTTLWSTSTSTSFQMFQLLPASRCHLLFVCLFVCLFCLFVLCTCARLCAFVHACVHVCPCMCVHVCLRLCVFGLKITAITNSEYYLTMNVNVFAIILFSNMDV